MESPTQPKAHSRLARGHEKEFAEPEECPVTVGQTYREQSVRPR